MTAPAKPEQDWRDLREWLIKELADARNLAESSPYRVTRTRLAARAEAFSSALDFMDERERQALR